MRGLKKEIWEYNQHIATITQEMENMQEEVKELKRKIEHLGYIDGTLEETEKETRENNIIITGLKTKDTEE